MNALATRTSAPVARQPSDAKAVAALMATQDAMTSIYTACADFEARYPGWRRAIPPLGWKPAEVDTLRRTNVEGRRAVEDAYRLLAALPPMEEMRAMRRALKEFHDQGVDERQTRLLVGLFVDRFPSGRPNSPVVFVEGLIHQALRGQHSPTVVAKALDELLTASPWLPSPHELQKALTAASHPGIETRALERAAGAARSTRDALAEAGKLGPVDMDPLWREALVRFQEDGLWSFREWGPGPNDPGCEAPKEILAELGYPAPAAGEIEF